MVPAPHQLAAPAVPVPAPPVPTVPVRVAPVPAGGRHGTRLCSRPGCAEPASATLTYHYERGSVWVDSLFGEREPHTYDLCERHAGRVSVPRGWRLEDRRGLATVPAPLPDPLPEPLPEHVAGAPVGSLPAPLPQRLAG